MGHIAVTGWGNAPAPTIGSVSISHIMPLVLASKNFYALKSAAGFKGKIISNNLDGLELDVDGVQVWFRIFGTFNAYNMLAVYGTAILLGQEPTEVLTLMSTLQTAPGRLEQVYNELGITAWSIMPIHLMPCPKCWRRLMNSGVVTSSL